MMVAFDGRGGAEQLREYRATEEAESERLHSLRAAGVTDNAAYRPTDWDASHGAWLVPVAELLKVQAPDLISGRAKHGSAMAAMSRAREVPSADEAGAALDAELAALADAVLDEADAEEELADEEVANASDSAIGGVNSAGSNSNEAANSGDALASGIGSSSEQQSAAAEAALVVELASMAAEEEVGGADGNGASNTPEDERANRLAAMQRRVEACQRASDEARSAPLVWTDGLDVPRQDRAAAVRKPPSVKTKRLLLSLTSYWHLWRLRRQENAGVVSEWGPSWVQLHDWLEYLSNSRRNRCLMEEGRLGAGEDQLMLYVCMLFKHVLPTLYPKMVDPSADGMGKGQYRAMKDDVMAAVHAMFTEGAMIEVAVAVGEAAAIKHMELHVEARVAEAARRVGAARKKDAMNAAATKDPRAAEAVARLAQLAALRTRVSADVDEAAAAIGQKAGEAAFEVRRKQTSKPSTRIHAAEADVTMVRDVLASEALRRNRSLVLDGFAALVWCAGTRPTSAANTGMDRVEMVSYWANHAPMCVSDFEVSYKGLNGGEGIEIEGKTSKLQVCKGKKLKRAGYMLG